jgi:osomolarity two-component system sensor histidine kinase NIK1
MTDNRNKKTLYRKLGRQALVINVEGTWRELLRQQTRRKSNISKSEVTSHLEISVNELDARGEILDTVNGTVVMVANACGGGYLCYFGSGELREVGRAGACTGCGRSVVESCSKCKCFFINKENQFLSFFLKEFLRLGQSYVFVTYRSSAVVTIAVARGDLTQKIEISVEGEMSTLKGTVNSIVDQSRLSAFVSEVTRVALGRRGGQAKLKEYRELGLI